MEGVEDTCKAVMSDGKLCGRKLQDDEHCIFHSKKDKDAKEFQRAFDEALKSALPKHYDFRRFVFPERVFFPKNWQRSAIFMRAVFSGDADFDGTVFQGDAEFGRAVFKSKASFSVRPGCPRP